jgi:hypothetical protein
LAALVPVVVRGWTASATSSDTAGTSGRGCSLADNAAIPSPTTGDAKGVIMATERVLTRGKGVL